MPLRPLAVAAVVLALATPATAGFVNGAQWLKLSAEEQSAYVAGVYDALVTYSTSTGESEVNIHYQTCAARARLTPESIVTALKKDFEADAKLMAAPMPGTFLAYLVRLCGRPEAK